MKETKDWFTNECSSCGVDEIHEDDCNCSDCVNDIMAGVAAMGPEDFE